MAARPGYGGSAYATRIGRSAATAVVRRRRRRNAACRHRTPQYSDDAFASGGIGWALSTAADALRDLLPLCPAGARVCAWVKPIGVPHRSLGLHNNWEPLIVVRGRQVAPGKSDWLRAQPARFGGTLPGRKPIAFAAWLFDCLGLQAGDDLVDLFPGTGIIGRAFASLSAGGDPSPGAAQDASLEAS